MKKFLTGILIVVGLVAAPIGLKNAQKMVAGTPTQESVVIGVQPETIPQVPSTLEESADIKTPSLSKTITLESANTVTLRGPVTGSSVAKAMKELRNLSLALPKSTPIYLVLDTPGGSIMDGVDLIEFAKALPQKVHTITLFAASMGFQIAQNLNTRYITVNGTLMSHRATVSKLGGQVKGELETRYRMIRRIVDYLDVVASKRMGVDLKTYENMILNEYWVYGFDSIDSRAADEQVLVTCGQSMIGSDTLTYETMFGPVVVSFSNCPLIKEPESINLGGISPDKREEIKRVISTSFEDKASFVEEFITTSKFSDIFR